MAFSIVCPTKKPALVGESLRKSLVLLRKVVPYCSCIPGFRMRSWRVLVLVMLRCEDSEATDLQTGSEPELRVYAVVGPVLSPS